MGSLRETPERPVMGGDVALAQPRLPCSCVVGGRNRARSKKCGRETGCAVSSALGVRFAFGSRHSMAAKTKSRRGGDVVQKCFCSEVRGHRRFCPPPAPHDMG